jgi:hypothetical protein
MRLRIAMRVGRFGQVTVADDIRSMACDGVSVAEIARRLGIRYQHAYNVLKAGGSLPASRLGMTGGETPARALVAPKPPLPVEELVGGGFQLSGRWILSEGGGLAIDRLLPKAVGVYAFARAGIVLYVGVATMGLAKRLYFYGKPGVTQRTSQRINGIIKSELLTAPFVEIYTAMPADFEWNGLPVHGSAGLELGLIKKFALPWNMRSAR